MPGRGEARRSNSALGVMGGGIYSFIEIAIVLKAAEIDVAPDTYYGF